MVYPAIFLFKAAVEEKPLNLELIDVQELFQQFLEQNKDLCAKSRQNFVEESGIKIFLIKPHHTPPQYNKVCRLYIQHLDGHYVLGSKRSIYIMVSGCLLLEVTKKVG